MTEITPSELRDIRLIAQGAGAERERIIELIESPDFHNAIIDLETELPDGNKVVTSNEALMAFNSYRQRLLDAIKGDQK